MASKQLFLIEDFSPAVNTYDSPLSLADNETPYALNMDLTRKGSLRTRTGYELAFTIDGVTGPLRGIMSYYRTYGSNSGDYLLIFHSNGKAYYAQNGSSTVTEIGTYGTDNGMVRGTVFNNLAIYGNGLAANTLQKWEGTGGSSNLGGTPPDVKYFGIFQKRVFAAGDEAAPSKVYYTEADTPETWNTGSNFINIGIGDGQDVTSLLGHNDFLQVMKDDSIYGVNFSFDSDYNLTVPQQQPIINRAGGSVAPGSAVPVYNNAYFLSDKGFQGYGVNPVGQDRRAMIALSWKIKNLVEQINLVQRGNINAIYYDDKYMCAAPLGTASINDTIFVYNEIYGGWMIYNNIPALQYAIFRDADRKKQLYFASAYEPKVFRFTNQFSDAGVGYQRTWRSKTFQYGTRTYWDLMVFDGSIVPSTELGLRINVDGRDHNFQIDNTDLIPGSGGSGYIGDHYVGSEYIGGGGSGSSAPPMYRFRKVIKFPEDVKEGSQMYFELGNSGDGQGWEINRIEGWGDLAPLEPHYPQAY